ncbi:hypothetical protein QBC40DRAFT_333101, partial [Triangularia verruculosa]
MLQQGLAVLDTGFYPFGDTPAVSLTQNLPPEADANILMLGCGDLRNVLFTNHSDGGRRKLDFTSRGILLATLIIDDTTGQQTTSNWNIYFHQYLSSEDHARLVRQAQKLRFFAESVETWGESHYGNVVRFCDHITLRQVSRVWDFYLDETNRPRVEAKIKSERFASPYQHFSGIRSFAPRIHEAVRTVSEAHENFWRHGSTDTDPAAVSEGEKYPNPMLVSPRIAAKLRCGENPLLGFHLATVFLPLYPKSPYAKASKQTTNMEKAVAVAHTEFSHWSDSFRKQAPANITVRFFVGDAIAFANTLQHRRNTGSSTNASWYRSRLESFDPLILNESEYGPNGDAPVSFTSIDTSNLIDHIGSIDLLVVTSPLLDGGTFSTLYTESLHTESLVGKSETHQAFVQNLFGTHLGFFSLLLGLFPIDYWTNNTSVCAGDEAAIDWTLSFAPEPPPRQLHIRMRWKRPPGPLHVTPLQPKGASIDYLNMDASNLAKLLFEVHLEMFPPENVTALRSAGLSFPVYCRASFAALLRFVKSRVKTDWTATIRQLFNFIKNDKSFTTGANYHQELLTYMHILDVCGAPLFAMPRNLSASGGARTGLLNWKDMPSIVCLTLKVPRPRLGLFTDNGGVLPVQCLVQDSLGAKWMNMFSAIQLGFGSIKTSGTPYTNTFSMQVEDDPEGWHGSSPLLVSFRIPTWILLQEPETATVAFALQHNPSIVQKYGGRLGHQLIVFRTKLGDESAVAITENPPNLKGAVSTACFGQGDFVGRTLLNPGASSTIIAATDGKLTTVTSRIDLKSQYLKSILGSGCTVKTAASSCCVWDVKVGTKLLKAVFPLPMLESSIKKRIARKSSRIKLIGTVITEIPKAPSFGFIYPVFLAKINASARPVPAPWNMPLLKLDILPVINIGQKNHAALSWLPSHLSHMYSRREDLFLEDPRKPERARVNFKRSLWNILTLFAGLERSADVGWSSMFALACNEAVGVKNIAIAIFISAMRLDLSNRTIVLDAAVMPATNERAHEQGRIIDDISKNKKLIGVGVTRDALRLWNEALPSMVERCRDWEHKESCEYLKGDKPRAPPLDVRVGERIICDCGVGVFPQGFRVEDMGSTCWKKARRQCSRAAISPMFDSSLVDEPSYGDRRRVRCNVCWAEKTDDGREPWKCAKCMKVRYCSQECQKRDGENHDRVCK